MRGLSRRQFFGGAAGVVAAAALPSSSSALATVASRRTRAAITPAVAPLAGTTVNLQAYGVKNYLDAANLYDSYVGLPLATTFEKIYMGHGSFPATPPAKVTQLAAAGCQFLISIEPNRDMTKTEQRRITAWLAMLNNAGISYRIVLYAECNNKAFATAEEWLTYWSYYAPVVQDAGVSCGYDPGCGYPALPRAEAYFPSSPAPSELWMDFYASAFRSGSRIDQLIAMAQDVGVSAGVGEWGWIAGPSVFTPMTIPWWNEYCAYLINLAQEGKLGLGGMYFSSKGNDRVGDIISSAADPRIPMIQAVSQAFQTG